MGNKVKPRDFPLDCYFEGITFAMREKLMRWLDRNTSGRLVFDHKPYVYYDVRPVKRIEIRQYTHAMDGQRLYSGTFTITFRCYDPFGILLRTSHEGICTPEEREATGILPTAMMPLLPGLHDRQFLLYNCGTERAHTIFRLAGDVGDGLEIENRTTGQRCAVVGLRSADLPPGAYLEIRSNAGQVWLVQGAERKLAFHYHDLGYIMLAPCTPVVRDAQITYSAGSKVLTSKGLFDQHMAGQYVYLDGGWRLIHRVEDPDTAYTDQEMVRTDFDTTPILTMNDIRISGDFALTRLEIEYFPRTR